jgi:hypothetical protein
MIAPFSSESRVFPHPCLAPIALLFVSALMPAQRSSAQSPPVPEWQKAAGGTISFEVASIRPTKPDAFTPPNFPLSSDDAYASTGGLFTADFPLDVYIEFAYKLLLSREQRDAMLARLPKWVETDNFEIHARGAADSTKDQMRLMMQSLLADRFKLAIHFETQQVPVLALTLVKPGKLGQPCVPTQRVRHVIPLLWPLSLKRTVVSTCTRPFATRIWPGRHRTICCCWVLGTPPWR